MEEKHNTVLMVFEMVKIIGFNGISWKQLLGVEDKSFRNILLISSLYGAGINWYLPMNNWQTGGFWFLNGLLTDCSPHVHPHRCMKRRGDEWMLEYSHGSGSRPYQLALLPSL